MIAHGTVSDGIKLFTISKPYKLHVCFTVPLSHLFSRASSKEFFLLKREKSNNQIHIIAHFNINFAHVRGCPFVSCWLLHVIHIKTQFVKF